MDRHKMQGDRGSITRIWDFKVQCKINASISKKLNQPGQLIAYVYLSECFLKNQSREIQCHYEVPVHL